MKNYMIFNYTNILPFLDEDEIFCLEPEVQVAHEMLHSRTGVEADLLGWVDLPITYDRKEFNRIQQVASQVQNDSDVLVVIGIGGSYLGARAAIEMLSHTFYNQLPKTKRKVPEIHFVGNHFSANYIADLIELLEDKNFSINMISKSGTTMEPAIAFRVFRELLEKRYGEEEARRRIYVTTDRAKGPLKKLADEKGYETFVIPEKVGGRYSVLTAVGLLPIAVAGIDICELMAGAQAGFTAFNDPNMSNNLSYQYAAVRSALYRKGKMTELLVSYDPAYQYFSEWWKQLFGESEGKDQKGIFPVSVNFTTDLHSIGQYIQDGLRNLFETIVFVEQSAKVVTLLPEKSDLDDLNYLAGKDLDFINTQAFEGTMVAHTEAGVPNMVIKAKEMNPYTFGLLIYFFEKACATSSYLLGVNPFNQPGVEAYKRNMFALLGKPGFEKEREKLLQWLEN
ncbi:glucose-6-phosphate isomerase [Hazenella coriacea]|uniref:Glucose-6-phosphate isomerase n=1 Tax=Hazenella coriacea TaxID=1179467 RepID=A0A4R3L1P9_9BACL|nr:glucose-6-phosphate isomerase [Hazenella coriacea]TCS93062.1 glucose-6-phosphate isomerase [Hazenella coriacea]